MTKATFTACECGFKRQQGSDLAEDQRAVCTAKIKRVLQGIINLHIPGCVGAIVQITKRVLIENVDRWRLQT